MANTRIKDLPLEAAPDTAADYVPIDSAAGGTRRAAIDTLVPAGVVVDADFPDLAGAMRRIATGSYTVARHNLTAVADPTVNDDVADGYLPGSLWCHVYPGDGGSGASTTIWICVTNNAGAARWLNITAMLAAAGIPFTANGDIAATNVQAAIQEVRDDTDTKLSAKFTTTSATTSVQGVVELATVAEVFTGTDTSRAVTADAVTAVIAQPKSRVVSGSTDTAVAGDLGNVVFVSQAAGCEVALNDLSASLVSGRMLMLTWQCEGAATVLTINPGTSVTIDGSASNYVAPTGEARVVLFSRDGLAWFSGTP